jgi:hypothetical protein
VNRRIAVVWIAAAVGATSARPLAQSDVLARIRDEGLNRSKVQSYFATLTDQFGPRLTGTPVYKQSAEWARDRMKGDSPERSAAGARSSAAAGPDCPEPRHRARRLMPSIGYAEAWSTSTKRRHRRDWPHDGRPSRPPRSQR